MFLCKSLGESCLAVCCNHGNICQLVENLFERGRLFSKVLFEFAHDVGSDYECDEQHKSFAISSLLVMCADSCALHINFELGEQLLCGIFGAIMVKYVVVADSIISRKYQEKPFVLTRQVDLVCPVPRLMDSANSWYTVNQKGEEENGKAIQCGV